VNVHEQKSPEDPDSPLSFSMEGTGKIPSPALHSYSWAPGWNSVQSLNKYQIEVGGPMHQGGNGKRLLHPENNTEATFYDDPPPKIKLNEDELHIVPGHHIFGSEELSMFSSSIAERAPTPYVMMHPEECQKRSIEDGATVQLLVKSKKYELPVKVNKNMAQGIAVMPVGLPDLRLPTLPTSGTISKK
jgi:NADH-quinone oxidoreductase subunit G